MILNLIRSKRLIVVFAMISIVIFQMALAEETNIVYTLDGAEGFKGACSAPEGGVYLLTSDALYLWRDSAPQGDAEVIVLSKNDGQIIGIAACEEKLLAITAEQSILLWRGDGWDALGQAPWSLTGDPIHRCTTAMSSEALYYTYTDTEGDIQLCYFDLNTCEFTQAVVFDAPWCAYDDRRCVLIGFTYDTKRQQWYLTEYDPSTGEVTSQTETDLPERTSTFAYDPYRKSLYFGKNSGVAVRAGDGAESEMPGVPTLGGLTLLTDGRLAGITNHCLGVYEPVKEEKGQITVLGFHTTYNSGFTQQSKILVDVKELGDADIMEEISRMLVTRDGSVDVIGFWSQDGLQAVKEKGFYTDLFASDVLRGAYEELYPNVAVSMRNGDELAVWPMVIQPSLRTEDRDILDACGIQTPETWEDLLDALPAVVASDLFLEGGYVPFGVLKYDRASMLEFFVQQYLLCEQGREAEVDFNTEVFRKVAGRILEEIPVVDPRPREDGTEDSVFQLQSVSNVINTHQLPPLRLRADAPANIEASVLALVVNPYSSHRAEAMAYVEYMATKRTVEDYALFASMDEPLCNEDTRERLRQAKEELAAERSRKVPSEESAEHAQRLQALELEIQGLAENLYIVTAEAIRQYQQYAPQLTVLENTLILYDESMSSLCGRLAYGNMTLDAFVEQANRHVQMIYTENAI